MECGPSKERILVSWAPPPNSALKFNIDDVARGKLGSARIRVLHKNKGGS